MIKIEEIQERLDSIIDRAPKLETPYGFFPSKGGDGGDDVLWCGLLSTIFSPFSLQVMYSQACLSEPREGMFYRNPLRRSNDNSGHNHFFSRDMALGVLLTYASSDHNWPSHSSRMWLKFIEKNRACAIKKPKWMGGGCLVRSPMYRYAPDDDRSNITHTMWALMGRVWDYKGWPRNDQMKKYKGSDGDISIISAETVPLGYQLHLLAVQSYLKFIIGQSREIRQKVSKICYERQPDNLFYKLVSQERAFDEDIDLFLRRCPKPEYFYPRNYWLWEKSDQSPFYSCGWDWVFLGNLLLKLYRSV